MSMTRKYIQFNDLVIDNFDMLADADLSGGFKTESTEYGYGHGSYTPFKGRQQFSTAQSLSMTIKLDTRKLSCEQRKYYKDYVFMNLIKPGRLWAVEGDRLLWTSAYVKDFSESYALEKYFISIDLDLRLYEGIWHRADSRKVFLQPYSACDFAVGIDFRDEEECLDCCVSCGKPKAKVCPVCLTNCEFLNEDNALCGMKKEATDAFYQQCGDSFKIIYNCEIGKKIWGEEKMLGQKICKEDICKEIIAGQFYSDTILDSDQVTVTIIGTVKNPLITINGNTMQILGEYNGRLTLTPSGDIYYMEDECCGEVMINISKLVIPDGSTFGFTVHHGTNGIIIETNDCCSMTCVYVKADSITI